MTDLIRRYAALLLEKGVSLQKDQILVVNADTEISYFVEILTEEAYKLGARDVEVRFSNERISRIRYLNSTVEVFETYPQFRLDSIMHYLDKGACVVTLLSQSPDNMIGVDEEKIAAFNKVSAILMTPYREKVMSLKIRWLVAGVPGKEWAKKLFPNAENPVQSLWDMILKCARADAGVQDPFTSWHNHINIIQSNSGKLNELDLESLHFKSSNGTDIILGICEDAIWGGGIHAAADGIEFIPNMPMEEVLTAPHKAKINGKVVASMPLNYQGTIIDKFYVTFKDGNAIDYHAEIGQEVLKGILEIDEGAKSLGEIALVPFSNPVNQTGTLFYTTLFDEHARCHLAFGAGYPFLVDTSRNPQKTMEERGLNVSNTHVDFMFGTADMECTGIKKDGTKVTIMKNGEIVL